MSGMYKQLSKQCSLVHGFVKSDPMTVIFAISLIALLIVWMRYIFHDPSIEGFDGEDSPRTFDVKRTVVDIYDGFYVSIYDKLVMNETKNAYELKHLKANTSLGKDSTVLDIGSGTGHHVGTLTKQGVDATGVDISKPMIDTSKREYPDATFVNGDAQDTTLFNPGSFTHITCLYFTIYYMDGADGIKNLITNCHRWMAPGGYMMIHLVERDKFDPILPAGSPFVMVPPQTFAKKRVTDTSVKFEEFQYTADYAVTENPDIATFKETFTNDKTQSVRKHELNLNMLPAQTIIAIMKDAGFVARGKQHMGEIGYDYQYLYTFQKK